MANQVQETYGPRNFTASGVLIPTAAGGNLGGFLCTTSGTIKLTQDTSGGQVIVDTLAVTAGQFVPLPFSFPPGMGVYVTLAGGALGTFAVN